MVITVTCPSCSSAFPVDPAKIPEGGVNARCSSCGDIFRVEKPAPAPTLADLAPDPVPAAAVDIPSPPVPQPAPDPIPPPIPDPTPEPDPVPPFPDPIPDPDPLPPLPEPTPPEPDPLPPLPEPTPPEPDPLPPLPEPTPPASDPFAESAPFEAQDPDPTPPAAPPVQGFTFGKRDPTDKAKRLARVLVSDMIMYNAERHQSALAAGTLVQDFDEEIDKSWKEYVEQVGEELANGTGKQFWIDALNDILAKGEKVF